MDHKISLIGFFLSLLAVVAGAFGIAIWFLSEVSSTTTLTLLMVITAFGVMTCGFYIWSRTRPNQKLSFASNGH